MRDVDHHPDSGLLERACRTVPRAAVAALLLAIACGLGGCAGGGAASDSFAMASAGTARARPSPSNRSTVRRRRCSTAWSACSTANRSCATSRSSPAKAPPPTGCAAISSAQVSHGRTTIAWVWDVYDRDQQRALRLSGEEPAGKAGRDAWAAADDLVLRKIAQAGLSGLTAMINGTGPGGYPAARPRHAGQTRPRGRRRRRRRAARLPPVNSASARSDTRAD